MAGGGTNSGRQKRRWFLRGPQATELIGAEGKISLVFKSSFPVAGVAWRKLRDHLAALHFPPVLTA